MQTFLRLQNLKLFCTPNRGLSEPAETLNNSMVMAISHPRYRIVNFRLSAEEYEAVFNAGEAIGARSMGEFARAAVLEKAHRKPGSYESGEQLQSLLGRFEEIENLVRAIYDRLAVRDATL
jgi:hypothetical protein